MARGQPVRLSLKSLHEFEANPRSRQCVPPSISHRPGHARVVSPSAGAQHSGCDDRSAGPQRPAIDLSMVCTGRCHAPHLMRETNVIPQYRVRKIFDKQKGYPKSFLGIEKSGGLLYAEGT